MFSLRAGLLLDIFWCLEQMLSKSSGEIPDPQISSAGYDTENMTS